MNRWTARLLATGTMLLAAYAAAPRDSDGNGTTPEEPAAVHTGKKPEITDVRFGSITVDGKVFVKDVVFENGKVRERKKGPSKARRAEFGHTPLTERENIPWKCKTLVIGTGMQGRLPVAREFKEEAERRKVQLILLKTPDAVKYFIEHYGPDINAILHITC